MHSGIEYPDMVLRASTEDHLRTLKDLAEFWKIPYTISHSFRAHQVVISSGQAPDTELSNEHPVIVTPAGRGDAKSISRKLNLELAMQTSLVKVPFSTSAETAIITELYGFKGSRLETILDSSGIPILSRVGDTNVYLLSIDLASEYALRISRGLEDSPSMRFKLATRLPLSYRIIPSFIRNRAFKSDDPSEVGKEKLAPVECLRTVFLASIVTVSKTRIPRIGFWKKGKKFALAVTHDVETRRGLLDGSQQLLRVEEDLQVRSTWNVVTNRYQLTRQNLSPLAKAGEIGAHDTDHDGRLIFLPVDARIRRLKSCRETLEKLTGTKVKGFRAPLLQHDKGLVAAVGKAGYQFDSSVPSWELLSPTSLRSHGLGTVFPLDIEGVVEMPVSLPQDHQLLRVRGLAPAEAGDTLIRVSRWVRELGGLCTLLIHPDYDFGMEDHGTEYSRILRSFRDDSYCEILTLGEAADWWSLRSSAQLENSNGSLKVRSPASDERVKDLEIQIVTSYGAHGFNIEHLN